MSKQSQNINIFLSSLSNSKTEEDVKGAYAKYFDIQYNTSDYNDLYAPQVLFEFKFDKNLKQPKTLATALAQTLYYVRRLKFGDTDKPIPPTLCLADRNGAALIETAIWKEFYTNDGYDWDLAPSSPDTKLCSDIAETAILRKLHVYDITTATEFSVFAEQLQKYLDGQISFAFADKKVITEDNFEQVFEYWNKIFGDSVRNGFKTSRYFASDIQEGNTLFLPKESRAIFRVGQTGELKEKKILSQDYEHFWALYEKVTDMKVVRAILAKIDRLTDETMRRFHGEFFTPLKFAKKALEYIDKTVPHWWQTGEYRLWDMAAGTGNLEYYLPQEALKYCYLSTLYKEDTEHLDKLFPDTTVFQYDYLNDDIGNVFADKTALNFDDITWKLPHKLRNDLKNPNIKWIILINPPFATAGLGGTSGRSKKGVSDTKIRKAMSNKNLGEVSRELFSQFLYRIKYEFENKVSYLGLFSTLKYINADYEQKLRDKVFQYKFEKGFVFSSANFQGTKANNAFPVGFLLWNLFFEKHIEKQTIELDIFNEEVEKTGTKTIKSVNRKKFLNKWLIRKRANIKFPPFSSAIKIGYDILDKRDRISEGFIVSLRSKGNDFQTQNFTYFLSGPCVSSSGISVIPENFEQAMVVHAARRIPKATWQNDRDQFMAPNNIKKNKNLDKWNEFVTDCAVWNLFSGSNQTAALRNVEYEGNTYQIHNHFFPFSINELRKWAIADNDIALQTATAHDTYVAEWLRKQKLSDTATAVLTAAREIYKFYFAHINELRTPKFKIETWDAGWWQIRMVLKEQNLAESMFVVLKEKHEALKAKILPQLSEYGIIN